MPGKNETPWVIPWGTCLTTTYTTAPSDVTRLLGLRKEDLARIREPERVLAFLARPDSTVRVVSLRRHPLLYAEAFRNNTFVAQVHLSARNFTFNLPVELQKFLGLQVYKLEGEQQVKATDDPLAWLMPSGEFLAYRKALRNGEKEVEPPGGVHIYLRRALFPTAMKSLEEMEAGRVSKDIAQIIATR
jgi:hypothetical protein